MNIGYDILEGQTPEHLTHNHLEGAGPVANSEGDDLEHIGSLMCHEGGFFL